MHQLNYPFDAAMILQKKRALKKELLLNDNFISKKIAIVGGSTVGEIRPILELFLLQNGIKPTFYEGGYGLYYEDVVFDDGSLAAFEPDVLYIHTSNRNIGAWPLPGDDDATVTAKEDDIFSHFEKVWQAAEKLGCPVVQNNFELPTYRNFGSLDAWDMRGRVRFINRLNEKFAQAALQSSHLYLHDLAYLAAEHGLSTWCDSAAWYGYKYTLAPACIPYLCHSLANLIKSFFGITKKAVVCDLDNTLWGGIIGEVEAEGIELGSETPAGMAYADFQEYLRILAARGVLLAVASKNELATAESGFSRIDSPLKRSDFLCFEAHWNPKSESIARIVKALNIGADSLVFADDNPAERQEVEAVFPMVSTVPIDAPEDSIRLLDRSGYFEVSTLSGDDIKRNEMYRQNAQRQQAETAHANYDDYLNSLLMTAQICPFRAEHVERITQLINKSNQFNLTTRRYTAAEVTHCMQSEEYVTLSAQLQDKFGDNGITATLIAKKQDDTLDIELFVMSCRVFKRGLEEAVFDQLVHIAQAEGIATITGTYLPTAKNLLTKDFYAKIGFSLIKDTETERVFTFSVPKEYSNLNKAIKVD